MTRAGRAGMTSSGRAGMPTGKTGTRHSTACAGMLRCARHDKAGHHPEHRRAVILGVAQGLAPALMLRGALRAKEKGRAGRPFSNPCYCDQRQVAGRYCGDTVVPAPLHFQAIEPPATIGEKVNTLPQMALLVGAALEKVTVTKLLEPAATLATYLPLMLVASGRPAEA